MADTGAIFGGEHSGHYYFRDNYYADSGLIAALMVLELLAESEKKLSELRKEFEPYFQSGEINSVVKSVPKSIEKVTKYFSKNEIDNLDGLTINDGNWWANIRPSNTEPLVRLNVEAHSDELCRTKTREILEIIRGEQ